MLYFSNFFKYLSSFLAFFFISTSLHSRPLLINASKNFFEAELNSQHSIVRSVLRLDIGHVFLSHGSFVGDDPLGLFRILKLKSGHDFYKYVKPAILKGLIADQAFFSDEYVSMMETNFLKTRIHRFFWSSGNYHYARLEGAVDLLDEIYSKTREDQNSAIMVIGHSHAAQLFALISQMSSSGFINRLKGLESRLKINLEKIHQMASALSQRKIYFVTLGGPSLYRWNDLSNWQNLHILNHRGPKNSRDSGRGWRTTEFGDYIQVLGSTDAETPPSRFRLDRELGKIFNQQKRSYFIDNSVTILADFEDHSGYINFHKTVFGHGIYTRSRVSGYLFQLIDDYLLKAE